jgi:putative FmdB family regulatory protein
MPTYQYQCTNCSYEFEEFQQISDDPIETCPECGGKVKRLISGGAGLLFKGSGFYITDYRSPKYQADAKKENSDKKFAKTEKKADKKSDKKTA